MRGSQKNYHETLCRGCCSPRRLMWISDNVDSRSAGHNIPGRTVRADIRMDIRLDIRKITDVRVELPVQPLSLIHI